MEIFGKSRQTAWYWGPCVWKLLGQHQISKVALIARWLWPMSAGPVTTWFIIKFALDCRTVPTITVSNTVSNTVSITVSNTVSILVSNAIGYTVGKTVSNTVSYTVSNTFGNTVSNMVSNTISNTVIIILVLRWLPSLPRTCLLIPIFGLVDPRA